MTIKTKIIASLVVVLVAFASGRYSVSNPTVKTHETTQTDSETKIDKNTHKVTTITEDKTGKKVTTITEDTDTKADKTKDSVKTIDQTVTPQKTGTVNISALAGFGLDSGIQPVYGLSVSKELIGPITVGAFGLTNRTLGISVGLNF
jgi:cytoskeletal protein RodZ